MRLLMLAVMLTVAVAAFAVSAHAADLMLLADQGAMTVTLSPGQTRALVRETRPLALPAGDSEISFTWAAAKVDAGSVALTVPGATVGEAVRPAGQDKNIIWRVTCPEACTAEVAVTYFLDGFRWQPSYRLTLAADGKSAVLDGFLQLTNDTGRELRDALVRVAIAGPGVIDRLGAAEDTKLGAGLYPVAQPCSVPGGDTRTWRFLSVPALPVALEYRFDQERYKGAVERVLRLDLTADELAGLALLPAGALTLYAADAPAPLFATRLDLQASREPELDLGAEPDVVVERKLMSTVRENIDRDRVGRISGSDTKEAYELTVRNHLGSDLTLLVTELLLSTWELQSETAVAKKDATTVQFALPVAAGQTVGLKFALTKHSGTRVK